MKIPTWIWAVVGCFLLVPLKAENESLWQVHAHNLHASYVLRLQWRADASAFCRGKNRSE